MPWCPFFDVHSHPHTHMFPQCMPYVLLAKRFSDAISISKLNYPFSIFCYISKYIYVTMLCSLWFHTTSCGKIHMSYVCSLLILKLKLLGQKRVVGMFTSCREVIFTIEPDYVEYTQGPVLNSQRAQFLWVEEPYFQNRSLSIGNVGTNTIS